MTYKSHSPEDTADIARRLASRIIDSGRRRAFIALYGEMGVGKTVFTRAFGEVIGAVGIKSPTYTIVNEHRARDGIRIYHFDLYRIESEDDLESIGYYDYIESDGYSIVEWPERLEGDLPDSAIIVKISRVGGEDEAREISVSGISLED